MGLKNEAQSALQSTKSFYREYVSGMTRERLGKEFYEDTDRLKQLYQEAIGEEEEKEKGRQLPGHLKFLRLFSSLTQRLNPTRRLAFGLSTISFVLYYFAGFIGISNFILFYDLLLPFSFGTILLLLLVELLEKSDVKREIDLAREIQLSLLPPTELKKENLEIYSFANTAKEVGGDYVDMIETEKGTYIVIADVSGKGLTAALYMVRMQALVHLLIEKEQPSPKELLVELNDYVKSDAADKTFVTACAAFFPHGEDRFTFARAGHNAPIFYNKERDATFDLRSDGFALGMTSTPNLQSFLQEKKFHFKKGDSVLFFTDGLTEARNEYGEQYGEDRVDSLMSIYGSLHAKTIVKKIHASLEGFIGKEKPPDDITFTCVHHPED
ncbi:serine/threonine-protein phosphatase [Aliifodinibius sp. S!AR15-10]|uniref:PP2C family protein-serine/threonine phosphatase n=1 Tax=Aliifodinibius sp. S!AR15-10 TaxID=2950437 RepID=UPI0028671CEA|nr:PP2C family protein-serine/threonine phosphatase [Aliifodinibius sp. S!AR15-10]MDR8390164.1 serine/threonine-protein phosphatase [Aliifodinibius sp. S!AR15-10]